MKAVSFINRGLIDINAVRVLGVSAKEGDNPIGFFGTGLKYAVAVLLRLGCRIELYRGEERFAFDSVPIEVRGQKFRVVSMNGQELGFTTDLGKTWEVWQAFRELYCNALDEGGSVFEGAADPAEEHTTVIVHGDAFHAAYCDRNNIVLAATPKWTMPSVRVHQRSNDYGYYRTVRAHKLEVPSALTYDITRTLSLTEDRTVKSAYEYTNTIRNAVLESTDADFLRAFLKASNGSLESRIDFDCWVTPSEAFLDVVEELGFRQCTNQSAFKTHKKHRRAELKPDPMPLNVVEQKMFDKAVRFVEFMGYKVREYDIVVTADLDENMLGRAYEGRIYINRSAFSMGTKMVAGTLIEEYIHLRHKLDDESRALQNHLLNALVSMGELAMGEPV